MFIITVCFLIFCIVLKVYHYQNAFKENNPYPKDYFEKK